MVERLHCFSLGGSGQFFQEYTARLSEWGSRLFQLERQFGSIADYYGHLDLIADRLGENPPEYDELDELCPAGADYFLGLFHEVAQGRAYGMAGPLPLGWDCFMHWQNLFNEKLSSYEIIMIRILDGAFLKANAPKG